MSFPGDDTTYDTQQRALGRIMEMHEEQEIVVVHTGETSVLQWNPATHEEVHEELPDGNIRTIIRPRGNTDER